MEKQGKDDLALSVELSDKHSCSVADFSAEPLAGTAPLEVAFSDESTGIIDPWEWDFGDNSELRTSNIIERLNKEFKRRTKPMEIVAGKNACYMLLAFISLKMEIHWKSNPIGKVRKNLPFFKRLAEKKITQLN